jgi:hypothetical protein
MSGGHWNYTTRLRCTALWPTRVWVRAGFDITYALQSVVRVQTTKGEACDLRAAAHA